MLARAVSDVTFNIAAAALVLSVSSSSRAHSGSVAISSRFIGGPCHNPILAAATFCRGKVHLQLRTQICSCEVPLFSDSFALACDLHERGSGFAD